MTNALGLFRAGLAMRNRQTPAGDISIPLRRLIIEAVRYAWADIVASCGPAIHSWNEDVITTLLQEKLNTMLDSPPMALKGFSSQTFQHVCRDGKALSFDGKSFEQMPDLTFRLCGAQWKTDHVFACECKHVRNDRTHLRDNYCHAGIARFVKSQYAWAMSTALMVGYADKHVSVENHLLPILAKFKLRAMSDPFATIIAAEKDLGLGIFTSTHRRSAVLPGMKKPLGPIAIGHLWLGIVAQPVRTTESKGRGKTSAERKRKKS